VEIAENQFGFQPGKSTIDPIFTIKLLMEECREKQQELHLIFVDLEKAYDTIPREFIWYSLREKNVPENLIALIKDTYRGAITKVRSKQGISRSFEIRQGLHQGSALSPLLFILILDVISRERETEAPWEMLCADDLVIVRRSIAELQGAFLAWKRLFERCGLKINMEKTEYMTTGEQHSDLRVEQQ